MSFFFLISSYNLSTSRANQSNVNLQFNNVIGYVEVGLALFNAFVY